MPASITKKCVCDKTLARYHKWGIHASESIQEAQAGAKGNQGWAEMEPLDHQDSLGKPHVSLTGDQ